MHSRLWLAVLSFSLSTPEFLLAATEAVPAAVESKQRLVSSYGNLPLSFEANAGQSDPKVKFLSRGAGYALYLTETGADLSLIRGLDPESKKAKRAGVRMRLAGANRHPKISGEEPLPGKVNYLVGNDPSKWKSGVPTYGKVKYQGVYPGVDLIYYGNQRQLEYDFIVSPGADPKRIALEFKGTRRMKITDAGDLLLLLPGGEEVRLHRPVVYQMGEEGRQEIAAGYRFTGKNQVGFKVARYDRGRPLIIDPVLVYSTYFGPPSSGFDFFALDQVNALAVDALGNAYLTGYTFSSALPVTEGAFQHDMGGTDAFVTKLNPEGTALLFSTYLGGSREDYGYGIAVDDEGNSYIAGATFSTDFPTTPGAYQPPPTVVSERIFVAKLNASGTALVYGALPGNGIARSIAVDASHNVYILGDQAYVSTTPGVFQPTPTGFMRTFVAKLNPAGSAPVYISYFGGSNEDLMNKIAADASGNAYLVGATQSRDFPLVNPIQSVYGGGWHDAFLSKISPGGDRLIYSTFIGGSENDEAFGIAADPLGNAYVAGLTGSDNFPVTLGVFQPRFAGDSFRTDAFILKMNPEGSGLVYSSYLGGSGNDRGTAVAVDSSGNAYVAGTTNAPDFPLVRAIKSSFPRDA